MAMWQIARRLTLLAAAACGLLLTTGAAAAEPSPSQRLAIEPMLRPAPQRVVTGTLDAERLRAIDEAGFAHIVSLQPVAEHPDFDEAAQAEALGLRHHHRPIRGAADLDREAARWLDEVLADIGEEPAVLHCASGNRVGALIALRAAWIEGMAAEAAIAKGKRWGLTRLEGAVRARLSAGD